MVGDKRTSNNRSNKSRELRKYEIAYNKCIKMITKSRKCKETMRKRRIKSSKRRKTRTRTRSRSVKKSLNTYQKFVRRESKKSIYKGRSVKSRMGAISKLWRKKTMA